MKTSKLMIYLLLSSAQALTLNNSYSGELPWINTYLKEIKVITDSQIEADYRTLLVQNAKNSIKLLSFDFQADQEVGIPLMVEFFRAAKRGVKIQAVTSKQAFLFKDRTARTENLMQYLMNHFPQQFDFVVVGGPHMWQRGWKILDTNHIKLMLVDDQIALVSGRGQTEDNLDWLDLAVTFKGNLVAQANEVFHKVWTGVKTESPFLDFTLKANYQDLISYSPLSSILHLWTTPSIDSQDSQTGIRDFYDALLKQTKLYTSGSPKNKTVSNLANWALNKHQNDNDQFDTGEPIQARALHHDFISQMKANHLFAEKSLDDRASCLNDSIVDAVIQSLQKALIGTNVYIYTFGTIFHPRFKSAILSGLRDRQLKIKVFTNSIDAYRAQSKRSLGIDEPVGYYASLADLDDIMQNGAEVFVLKNQDTFPYVHRKLAVVGDHVFFGSHNLTLASTTIQEELQFEIISKKLASHFSQEFDALRIDFAHQLSPEKVHRDRNELLSICKQWLFQNVKYLF